MSIDKGVDNVLKICSKMVEGTVGLALVPFFDDRSGGYYICLKDGPEEAFE